ncbi:MAG: ABC transporter permease [Chloroflexota bacterium]
MTRILDITFKDLTQVLRDRKTFMFLLIMPIAFTLLFGFAFGGSNGTDGPQDDRLPVAVLDQDGSAFSQELIALLATSAVIRIEMQAAQSPEVLRKAVNEGDWVAALVVPAGYGDSLPAGTALRLRLLARPGEVAAQTAQNEIAVLASRLMSAAHTARLLSASAPLKFETVFREALSAWENPPVQVQVRHGKAVVEEEKQTGGSIMDFSHTSPGMILQFAIAGLLTAAQVLVNERKNRCLPRLLTTSASRVQVLLGHYLSIFLLIFMQFTLLILFGQIFLKVDYFGQPLAILLVTLSAVACLAALGLLIGVVAKSEEQAVAFSMICMFVFAGLGGAWMPLEFTGAAFQAVGHVTPVAWAMDGFKNITARGLGLDSVLLPATALLGYALLFFTLSAWRFGYETAK